MELWKRTENEPADLNVVPKTTMQANVSSEEKMKNTGERRPQYKNTIHLWEFLLELLADDRCTAMISWSRKDYGEFILKDHEEVAKRWGILKQRPGMNYDKLSRALRYYYKQGIVKKVPGQKLVYRFDKLPYNYKPGITSIYQEQLRSEDPLERKRRYLRNIHEHCSQSKAIQALSSSPVLQEDMVKFCSCRQPKFYYPDSYLYNSIMCSCMESNLLQTSSVPIHMQGHFRCCKKNSKTTDVLRLSDLASPTSQFLNGYCSGRQSAEI